MGEKKRKCAMIDGRRGNRIEMNANELNEMKQSEKRRPNDREKRETKELWMQMTSTE